MYGHGVVWERIVIAFSGQYSVVWFNAWAGNIIPTWSPCWYNYEEMKWKYWCNSVNKDSKDLDDEDGEIQQRVLDKKRQTSPNIDEDLELHISDRPIPQKFICDVQYIDSP